MRKKIIAGNWKMNKTVGEAKGLVEELIPLAAGKTDVDIVVCPSFVALDAVEQMLRGTNIALGAQGAFWKEGGAYTSFVSLPMLADVGVRYVLVGHSETRGRFGVEEKDMTPDLMRAFGETDKGVHLKTKAILDAGLTPIVCIGETLTERQAGDTDLVVQTQVVAALNGLDGVEKIVFAYEPVWAIGTGEVCAPDEANRVCAVVRQAVASVSSPNVADAVRIQYGGSMKPDNARQLLSQSDIDGGLIGGASLKAADFAAIVAAAS